MTNLFNSQDPEDGSRNVEAAGEADKLVEEHLHPDMVLRLDGNS